jgi:hypothetical protein
VNTHLFLEELDSTYRSSPTSLTPQRPTWPGAEEEVMAGLEVKEANDRIYNVLCGAGALWRCLPL